MGNGTEEVRLYGDRSAATNELGITALGRRVTAFEQLETFPCPQGVKEVKLVTDEVTANCPVTGQPDFYKVTVTYFPQDVDTPDLPVCVESKTVKLYFQQFRDQGLFCESFAWRIAVDFGHVLKTKVFVTVEQKSRGGVAITAHSSFNPEIVYKKDEFIK